MKKKTERVKKSYDRVKSAIVLYNIFKKGGVKLLSKLIYRVQNLNFRAKKSVVEFLYNDNFFSKLLGVFFVIHSLNFGAKNNLNFRAKMLILDFLKN